MKINKVQFIFEGGLGNQLFQFFASKYVEKNFQNFNIRYGLSEHILGGYRDFELNKILKHPIKLEKEFNQIGEKIYKKIIFNISFLSQLQKIKLKSKIDLINNIYYEKEFIYNKNPLKILSEDLNYLSIKLKKLKIKGYWQNPECYLKDLNYYRNLLIDTKPIIVARELPERYITIHVRRGDFLSNKRIFENYYSKFSPVEFILLSLNLIPQESKNYPIYIISDDKGWVKNLINSLSSRLKNNFFIIDTKDHFEDWAIMRHSSINICSNSTFSYTAALLNYDNLDRNLRSIIPQWIDKDSSAFEKGWLIPKGFIEI